MGASSSPLLAGADRGADASDVNFTALPCISLKLRCHWTCQEADGIWQRAHVLHGQGPKPLLGAAAGDRPKAQLIGPHVQVPHPCQEL